MASLDTILAAAGGSIGGLIAIYCSLKLCKRCVRGGSEVEGEFEYEDKVITTGFRIGVTKKVEEKANKEDAKPIVVIIDKSKEEKSKDET